MSLPKSSYNLYPLINYSIWNNILKCHDRIVCNVIMKNFKERKKGKVSLVKLQIRVRGNYF